MSDILFEVLKLIVMVGALLIGVRVLPYLKANIAADKIDSFRTWALDAVLYAQQMLWSETGETRKRVVFDILTRIRDKQNIDITDDQIDILIEAAVKQLHIEEEVGYVDIPIYSEVENGDSSATD